MIEYTDKGAGLHAYLAEQGISLVETFCNGVSQGWYTWPAHREDEAQSLIDAYTLAQAIAHRVGECKQLAGAKILARYDFARQAKYHTDLALREFGSPRWLAAHEAMGWIAMVQDASDVHEAALITCDSWDALAAYDLSTGWPE